jgi:hypothetical protein
MKIVYVGQELPTRHSVQGVAPNSIFLAGPTPRGDDVKSWRPEACEFLRAQGFEGHVFVPEADGGGWLGDYEGQVHWEWEALGIAACAFFWVPRNLENMPGFTTNVEYGFMTAFAPHRVVLGAPQDAPKLRYLQSMASECKRFHSAFQSAKGLSPIIQTDGLKKALLSAMVVATPDD